MRLLSKETCQSKLKELEMEKEKYKNNPTIMSRLLKVEKGLKEELMKKQLERR